MYNRLFCQINRLSPAFSHISYKRYSTNISASSSTSQLYSNFCKICGNSMSLTVPIGDNKQRSVCNSCGFTDYINPKMVVGALVEHNGSLLLCRRGIQPQKNKWTVPAGFLEVNESTAEGAARETMEEAHADIEILSPYVHFDIPTINQSYLLFRAVLKPPYTFRAKEPESLETRLFKLRDIPYSEMAFSSVTTALRFYEEDTEAGMFKFRHGVITKDPLSGPNGQFQLTNLYTVP